MEAVVVRAARPDEWAARAALVRRGIASHHFDAFMYFFFQELTLQACVLCGAVLFIFCGAAARALLLLLPVAAAAVCAAGVLLAHAALAHAHAARLPAESTGLVAECRAERRVVGTASVGECWGGGARGWLHLLAVEPGRRRRGVARALLAAARERAARAGLESLETAVSHVQADARALLHATGWQTRGTYHRPVLGTVLTLPMARLGLELPYA